MEAKDVKVGMRVVPHSKTTKGFDDFDKANAWNRNGGKEQGFLYVKGPAKDRSGASCFMLSAKPENSSGDWYNASDFSPAEIEVGDTVRLIYVGKERVVSSIRDGRYYMLYENGKGGLSEGPIGFSAEGLDLVRKAKRAAVTDCATCKASGETRACKSGSTVCANFKPLQPDNLASVTVPNSEIPKPADRRPTVGDWVEIVGSTCGGHPIGTIGKVMDAADIDSLAIEANGKVRYHCRKCYKLTTPPEQKPREFKVGDRVRDDVRGYGAGTVKTLDVGGWYRVGVQFQKSSGALVGLFWYTIDGRYWMSEPASLCHATEPATEPATVLKSDADAAVRRAFDAGFIDGQKAMKSRVASTEIVPNPSKAALEKFWEAD